jgi:hypothetical protein
MDQLDQVVETAGPLLRRVDDVLAAAGAPGGHGVWAQLRRVRLLPADAVCAVAALRPAALADAVPELRATAREYAAVAATLPVTEDWSGEAADAYDALRDQLADHLGNGLVDRLRATSDLAEAITHWMQDCRSDLAAILAEVLGSVEAVALAGAGSPADGTRGVPGSDAIGAAADIAVRVLRTVADGQDRGAALMRGSAGLTAVQPVVSAGR